MQCRFGHRNARLGEIHHGVLGVVDTVGAPSVVGHWHVRAIIHCAALVTWGDTDITAAFASHPARVVVVLIVLAALPALLHADISATGRVDTAAELHSHSVRAGRAQIFLALRQLGHWIRDVVVVHAALAVLVRTGIPTACAATCTLESCSEVRVVAANSVFWDALTTTAFGMERARKGVVPMVANMRLVAVDHVLDPWQQFRLSPDHSSFLSEVDTVAGWDHVRTIGVVGDRNLRAIIAEAAFATWPYTDVSAAFSPFATCIIIATIIGTARAACFDTYISAASGVDAASKFDTIPIGAGDREVVLALGLLCDRILDAIVIFAALAVFVSACVATARVVRATLEWNTSISGVAAHGIFRTACTTTALISRSTGESVVFPVADVHVVVGEKASNVGVQTVFGLGSLLRKRCPRRRRRRPFNIGAPRMVSHGYFRPIIHDAADVTCSHACVTTACTSLATRVKIASRILAARTALLDAHISAARRVYPASEFDPIPVGASSAQVILALSQFGYRVLDAEIVLAALAVLVCTSIAAALPIAARVLGPSVFSGTARCVDWNACSSTALLVAGARELPISIMAHVPHVVLKQIPEERK